jgi:predicted ferric reductase
MPSKTFGSDYFFIHLFILWVPVRSLNKLVFRKRKLSSMVTFHWTFLALLSMATTPTLASINKVPACYLGCEAASQLYLLSNCNSTALSSDELSTCQCQSVPYLGSMAICYSNNCGNQASGSWSYLQNTICAGQAIQSDYRSILTNATHYARQANQVNTTEAIYYPVIFSKGDVEPTMQTVTEFRTQLYYGILYGGATNIVVFTFIFLGMINNMYNKITARWASVKGPKKKSMVLKVKRYLRKILINPALFPNGSYSRQSFFLGVRVTIPTRTESIAVLIFLIINVIVLLPNYRVFNNNTYWPDDTAIQLGRYIADRSGIIAFTQLPMIYLFAGRNNLLLFLTGWSYDRFIVAHKWISRTMFFHSMVHSLAYTWYPWHVSGWSLYVRYAQDLYFQYGVAATVIGALILWFAMPTFRRWSYEIFLVGHIVMVIGFTVGLWYHVKLIELDEYLPWLWASITIWVFDRFIRLLRIIYLNLKISRKGNQICIAEMLPEDCIRLRIPANRAPLNRLLPGAYVYIYIPSIYFWQSHPFTIASWSQVSATETIAGVKSDTGIQETSIAYQDTALALNKHSFDLLIRPQRGLTGKLYNKVLKNHSPLQMNVLIEGPYGHTAPMTRYETAIYIAGGVGVSATLSYVQQAVSVNRGCTRHIVFIWIVRTSKALSWIQEELCRLLQVADAPLAVDMELYVTKETESETIPKPLTSSVHLGVRPDLSKRIHNCVTVAPSSVAVLACGPPGMNDEIRAAVSEEGIPYFEDSFIW